MHVMNTAEPFNKLISCKCRAFISCLFGPVYIRKDLIIQKPFWSPRREALALIVDIVLTDSLKGGSSLSELPGRAALWGRGGGVEGMEGGCGIRGLPRYLCIKGHTGLAEEAKATTICVFHTHCGAAI